MCKLDFYKNPQRFSYRLEKKIEMHERNKEVQCRSKNHLVPGHAKAQKDIYILIFDTNTLRKWDKNDEQ